MIYDEDNITGFLIIQNKHCTELCLAEIITETLNAHRKIRKTVEKKNNFPPNSFFLPDVILGHQINTFVLAVSNV